MLEKPPEMQLGALMGRQAKRTRTTAGKSAVSEITVRPFVDSEGYTGFLVQGWKEEGKWKRKQFRDRKDAERFAALKRVEVENQGRAQRMVLSPLTDEQQEQAVRAFDKLGQTYSLDEAVAFFLKHHRPPEFTIRLKDAANLYLDDKERDGLRSRTLKAIRSVLGQFLAASDNPFVHEVTAQEADSFLKGLRAKDGTNKATRKTWNNYRNDLHGFFHWSATPDAASNRPYTFTNPIDGVRKFSARQVREEQSAKPETTPLDKVRRFMGTLIRW
ncbi:MAG: hypothetical protein QM680_14605, partial [Luteolibacter sp.]